MLAAWNTDYTGKSSIAGTPDSANCHLSPANRLLLQDLGQCLGLTLDMPEGAVRLAADNGPDWFLEITDDGELWIIHTEICPRIDATPEMLNAYLQLNAQITLMRGAAVCIEENTGTVRLHAVIRTQQLDTYLLENTLAHLMQLYREHISLIHHF